MRCRSLPCRLEDTAEADQWCETFRFAATWPGRRRYPSRELDVGDETGEASSKASPPHPVQRNGDGKRSACGEVAAGGTEVVTRSRVRCRRSIPASEASPASPTASSPCRPDQPGDRSVIEPRSVSPRAPPIRGRNRKPSTALPHARPPDRRRRLAFGSVEDGPVARIFRHRSVFPHPLIEPDVLISRIRLSDRLRGKAHDAGAEMGAPELRHPERAAHRFPQRSGGWLALAPP